MRAPQRVADFQGRRRRQSVYISSELTDMFTVLRSLLLTCQAAGRTTSQVADWQTEHQEETCASKLVAQPRPSPSETPETWTSPGCRLPELDSHKPCPSPAHEAYHFDDLAD